MIVEEYREQDGFPVFDRQLKQLKREKNKLDRLFPPSPSDPDSYLWLHAGEYTPAHDVALALGEARGGMTFEVVNGPDKQGESEVFSTRPPLLNVPRSGW